MRGTGSDLILYTYRAAAELVEEAFLAPWEVVAQLRARALQRPGHVCGAVAARV